MAQFLKKRTATNPKRGPIHPHSPSKLLWRTVRGMVPHKLARGKEAMLKFKVSDELNVCELAEWLYTKCCFALFYIQSFEGVPHPYDRMKRVVVPDALRVVRLNPSRKFTNLGELSAGFGWKYKDLISTLEEKRKVKSKAFYEKKQAKAALKAKAEAEADLSAVEPVLTQCGY